MHDQNDDRNDDRTIPSPTEWPLSTGTDPDDGMPWEQ